MTNLTASSLPGPDERRTLREWANRRLQSVGHDPPIEGQDDPRSVDLPERNFRAAMLAHLAEKRFVPEAALFYAVRGGDTPFTSAVRRCIAASLSAEVETVLGPEVDEFCRSFFQLPPDVRQSRWLELCEQVTLSDRLTARLQQLAAGLAVDLKSFANETPELRHLAEAILEIFLMPPHESAARTRAFLQTDRPDSDGWRVAASRAAAGRLVRRFPQVANLNRVLVRRVRSREHRWHLGRQVRVQGVDAFSQATLSIPQRILVFIGVIACVIFGIILSLDEPGNAIRRAPPQPRAAQPDATQRTIQILNRITRAPRPPSAPNFESPVNPRGRAAGPMPPAPIPGRAPQAGLPFQPGGNFHSPPPSPTRPGPRR